MSFQSSEDAERFVEQYRTAVYYLALSILKHEASAEDVSQNVFLSLCVSETPVSSIKKPYAFLAKATKNHCLNYIRDNQHSKCLPLEEDAEIPDFTESRVEDMAVYSADIEGVLACLNHDERLFFSLHNLIGYKFKELAALFNVPIGSVMSKCHSAKKKLKKALETTDDT